MSDPATLDEMDVAVLGRGSQRAAALDALRALRARGVVGVGVRVLWVSASNEVLDTLRAFEAGADDVVRAPFVYAELLLARVRALMRRDRQGVGGCFAMGRLRSTRRGARPPMTGHP